jgi:small conductance mechanosensitive channel
MGEQLKALDQVQSTAIDLAMKFGPKLVVAVLILFAGHLVGGWAARTTGRMLARFQFEPPVRNLIERGVRILVLVLFVIMALQNLGVDLLPLIAGVGVAGAGVALAMQGVLGNIVAGLTIIFTRPFKVGDWVSIAKEEGEVLDISLSSTVLGHADLSRVVIPNRKIVGEILHNYGQVRQLDLGVVLSRPGDLEATLALVGQVVGANPRVLKEPAPVIGVAVLADTSYRIAIKPWVAVPDVVAASGEINRAVVEALRAADVRYPMLPPGEALMEAAQRRP